MGLILADVRAGEHVVAESNDVGAVATIILFAEIEDLRLKSFDELTDMRRIGATKLVTVRSAHRRLRNLKTFHFHLSYKSTSVTR